MHFPRRSKVSILFTVAAILTLVIGFMVASLSSLPQAHASPLSTAAHVRCDNNNPFCTEVYDSEKVFGQGKYVGHDEPATLFYSNVAGSGNQMRYHLTLPKDPGTSAGGGKYFNFQLHIALWFGMAMCDTQSFPEQVSFCTPDSDSNIVDPAISPKHPGTAFMELQFYPPGWVSPPFAIGTSCDPTKWCAAMTIDSLSDNPVTGQPLNSTCQSEIIGGEEYINFAFITKNGVPQPNSPPNPRAATLTKFIPNPKDVLFMNSGDQIAVTLHDTAHGLSAALDDVTTGGSGSMTASAANGFGQIKFAPTGTSCQEIPYDFHPMYSTSSEKTRVPWAAHSYNIAFTDEIGHFDFCNGPSTITFNGNCPSGNKEGIPHDQEPSDGDDLFCFPASASTLIQVSGCTNSNTGFDGTSYQAVWPDGHYTLHPTPIQFTSPLTGSGYTVNYSRVAFETDLPRIENPAVCNRFTGTGCTLIPTTDDPDPTGTGFQPAVFYPFFGIKNQAGGPCLWRIGNHIPDSSNEFGQNAQYGTLLNLTYTTTGGGPTTRYNDFRNILSRNPCLA